jgi:hypothetical protein
MGEARCLGSAARRQNVFCASDCFAGPKDLQLLFLQQAFVLDTTDALTILSDTLPFIVRYILPTPVRFG